MIIPFMALIVVIAALVFFLAKAASKAEGKDLSESK
jgi:hypothetical protein